MKSEGSMKLDIKALIREAFRNLNTQVDAKKKLKMATKLRRMVIEEEETSQKIWVNDAVSTIGMTVPWEKVWNKPSSQLLEKRRSRERPKTRDQETPL